MRASVATRGVVESSHPGERVQGAEAAAAWTAADLEEAAMAEVGSEAAGEAVGGMERLAGVVAAEVVE